jgi:mannose-1-phosphate guanylyltransferase
MANYSVIMAGGRGERFWPLSRQACPKHLLPIVGRSPMIAQTVARLGRLVPPQRVFILTNRQHVAAIRRACPKVPRDQIIGEPLGRDTAPAVALAALLVSRRDPKGVLALLPADAAIHDTAGFQAVLKAAFSAAEQNDLIVTLGIRPTQPATGYGYLKCGEPLGEVNGRAWHRVERFVEKPDLATAERYLADGGYLWNAGMFVARASVLLQAFRQHAPLIAEGLEKITRALDGRRGRRTSLSAALTRHYPGLPKISMDYAVMEKAGNVAVFEAAFDWDDVGEWPALARHEKPDTAGNISRGCAEFVEAKGNIVVGNPRHLVALLGVDNLVVVQTADATLVCPKARAQDLKKLLSAIAARPTGQQWL